MAPNFATIATKTEIFLFRRRKQISQQPVAAASLAVAVEKTTSLPGIRAVQRRLAKASYRATTGFASTRAVFWAQPKLANRVDLSNRALGIAVDLQSPVKLCLSSEFSPGSR